VGSLSWSASEYAHSCKEEVDESKRLWKTVPRRCRKIRRIVARWTVVGETINWLTTYAIYRWVIVRYTKLPTIVQYKVGFVKGRPTEEKYLMLTLMRVSTVFLSISLVRLRISATYFDWERR
jgi:regulation of enolase protein 1 (concanavalin A-like superfamily)